MKFEMGKHPLLVIDVDGGGRPVCYCRRPMGAWDPLDPGGARPKEDR